MKKYLPAALAVVIAVGLSTMQSFTTVSSNKGSNAQASYNWYPVGTNNKILSTTPSYTSMTKTDVIAVDPCKDKVLPNCLFGTNGTVTVGQDISAQPSAQRITHDN
jgi:hypothetical protein